MKKGEIWQHTSKQDILEIIIVDIDNEKDCVLWKYSKPPVDKKIHIYLRKNFLKHYRKVYNEYR